MGQRTLNEQILDLLEIAIRPLSAAEIRRRIEGNVDAGEISSRLSKMLRQGKVAATDIASQAITGPRKIKGWVSISNPMTMEYLQKPANQETPDKNGSPEYIPDIAQTQQNGDISFGEVASGDSAATRAA